MFIKTHLNWANLVSEASCPGRLNPCVKHVSIRFVAILNEWGITPLRRDKKKSLAAQICKNITHNRYRNGFRAKINVEELYLLDKTMAVLAITYWNMPLLQQWKRNYHILSTFIHGLTLYLTRDTYMLIELPKF